MDIEGITAKVKLLDDYKAALEEDVDLSVMEFCRQREVEPQAFTGWLQRNGILITDIKNEVRKRKGLTPLKNNLATRYGNALEEYRMRLEVEPDLSFRTYCIQSAISPIAFAQWIRRNGYSVKAIKEDVLRECQTEKKHTSQDDFATEAVNRFTSTLDGYKKHLRQHNNTRLSIYCKEKGVEYKLMKKWMDLNGVSEKQIKTAEMIRRANEASPITNMLPINPDSVFVQFRPNGGTNGDKLKGVNIRFPDGKLLQIEECTVISLCSLINIYDKNQR